MSGKVLVSIREHMMRLMEARKEADKLGSKLMIIARTDAEAAKLLQSNEDPRDHYFILGSTNKNLPTLNITNWFIGLCLYELHIYLYMYSVMYCTVYTVTLK